MWRQGDVLIIPCGFKTDGMKKVKRDKGRIVLAYGEVTGHAHALLGPGTVLFDNGKGIRILAVENEALLKHEEHSTIKIPKGTYEVRIQREYHPEEIRNVQD